jgi:cobalt-zinc-cadmium resistance protein CzcA
MLSRLIDACFRNRLLVCGLALAGLLVGTRAVLNLPVDAFPDTTPVQVQINTTAPALGPEEIEAQITQPIELALAGLPGLESVRSISKFGLSQVVATFDDHSAIFRARQSISERLQGLELPEGIAAPQLGPISTGLGEVFHYVLRSDNTNRTLAELREWQDWVIKPQLRKVRGVAEVNTWGGFEKQFHVIADPDRLIKHRLTLDALVDALQSNNQNVGGGQVVRAGESLLVQGIGLATNLDEIGAIVITAHEGSPVRVRDVAVVQVDHEIRRGAVTGAGRGEVVLGLGFMLMGENSAVVTHALKERLDDIRPTLPADIQVEVFYDRTELVDKVIRTVEHNLFAGAILVVAVLLAFLGNLRAGLTVALAIPASFVFAGNLMLQSGIAASLLSLGALDFGILVDGSVVMVENALRRVIGRQAELGRALTSPERVEIVRLAAHEVARPVAYGVGIILVVFLPVLTLEGIEGKLFRPMALTTLFALVGSLLIALTVVPVVTSFVLPARLPDREPWLVRLAHRLYAPVLDLALRFPRSVLATAFALIVAGGLQASRLGGEFLPKLGEQALAVSTVRLSGISVDEAADWNTRIEQELLREFPDEIEHVWTRLGTAEVATDPMGIELSDFFIALKPRETWTKARSQPELIEAMRRIFQRQPGMTAAFSQPIEMRMNEMIAGVRGDLALKIFGDDLEVLKELGEAARAALAAIPGAGEVASEQMTGQPVLRVKIDPEALARHGLPARHVLEVVEAVGSRRVGEIREGQRRFPLVVRLPDRQRTDPEALADTLIPTADGPLLPLSQVASVTELEGPATITREWGKRRIVVQCSVRGRDVAGFVAEARERIAASVRLPEGYSFEWGGQFENMQRANRRLAFVVPVALGLILALLHLGLRSLRDVLVVASGIPLGAVGGVFALALRGLPFTVSAGIGFIALSGVAILNGLVLVSFIRERIDAGTPAREAVREGCLVRLRPVLITALVAAVGFVPMAVNLGVGGEVQRPLATVVIGGLLSNTLLTLVVLPTLHLALRRRQVR